MKDYINEKLKESLKENVLQANCFLSKELWENKEQEEARKYVSSHLASQMSHKIVERHFDKIEPFGDDFQGKVKVVVLTPEEFKRHLVECYEAGVVSQAKREFPRLNILSISELERLENDC